MSYWDEFSVGKTEKLGSHRFEAEDIKRFAAKYDPQVFHLDEEKARASVLGGLCASGWHTCGVFMKLNVETRTQKAKAWIAAGNPPPKTGPSPGVRNIRWPKPVFAGDTITYSQVVTGKRETASRPGWGIIEFATKGVNERGEEVFSVDGAVFCATD